MVDTNTIRQSIPRITGFVDSTFDVIAWLIIFLIFLATVTVVTILIVRRINYKYKIIIFEKIDGQFKQTGRDRARELKIGKGGDVLLYLQKRKLYRPMPSIQSGNRVFWYFIREDGEWINFGLADLDESSRQIGARFLDKEARYARTQIQRGLKERYDKPSFMEKYGLLIFGLGYIALIGIMTWLLFDKWIDLASTTNAGVSTAGEVIEKANAILSTLDNICSGGSGVVR